MDSLSHFLPLRELNRVPITFRALIRGLSEPGCLKETKT